jgi:hypothetical protein
MSSMLHLHLIIRYRFLIHRMYRGEKAKKRTKTKWFYCWYVLIVIDKDVISSKFYGTSLLLLLKSACRKSDDEQYLANIITSFKLRSATANIKVLEVSPTASQLHFGRGHNF